MGINAGRCSRSLLDLKAARMFILTYAPTVCSMCTNLSKADRPVCFSVPRAMLSHDMGAMVRAASNWPTGLPLV